MPGKSDTFENDLLKLIFNGTTIANLAINATSSPLTNLYVALHTGVGPEESEAQTTNEISYTGYARAAVARTSVAWVVTGNSVSPALAIDFPEMTGGTGGTATHVSVGTAASGAGKILYSGALTPSISVTTGVIPRIKTTSTITES